MIRRWVRGREEEEEEEEVICGDMMPGMQPRSLNMLGKCSPVSLTISSTTGHLRGAPAMSGTK